MEPRLEAKSRILKTAPGCYRFTIVPTVLLIASTLVAASSAEPIGVTDAVRKVEAVSNAEIVKTSAEAAPSFDCFGPNASDEKPGSDSVHNGSNTVGDKQQKLEVVSNAEKVNQSAEAAPCFDCIGSNSSVKKTVSHSAKNESNPVGELRLIWFRL